MPRIADLVPIKTHVSRRIGENASQRSVLALSQAAAEFSGSEGWQSGHLERDLAAAVHQLRADLE
jgi:hypothetical protein